MYKYFNIKMWSMRQTYLNVIIPSLNLQIIQQIGSTIVAYGMLSCLWTRLTILYSWFHLENPYTPLVKFYWVVVVLRKSYFGSGDALSPSKRTIEDFPSLDNSHQSPHCEVGSHLGLASCPTMIFLFLASIPLIKIRCSLIP